MFFNHSLYEYQVFFHHTTYLKLSLFFFESSDGIIELTVVFKYRSDVVNFTHGNCYECSIEKDSSTRAAEQQSQRFSLTTAIYISLIFIALY